MYNRLDRLILKPTIRRPTRQGSIPIVNDDWRTLDKVSSILSRQVDISGVRVQVDRKL